MRVASFNILHGSSTADGRVDLDRLGDAVARLDADVLALQEVDRGLPRSHRADLAAVAARALGAEHVRFVPTIPAAPAPDGSARGYGIAVVSRHPVRRWATLLLPRARVPKPVLHANRLRLVRDEPRVAIVATVDTPAGALTVAGTHLSFLAPWSQIQLPALLRSLRSVAGPVVVAGDLNLTRPAAPGPFGYRPVVRGRTFPAHAPVRQLDHLLVRGAVTATGSGVMRLPVSDHRAVWADLTLD